jgi:4-hydroxybenzoate polyprenyltransferase
MKKAWLHKIWLSWLPSHSSHITQPLDVAVFGPLKTYYHQLTRSWATYEATSPHQQQLFLEAYERASQKAMSQRNITSGFSKSGVFPICVQKAIEALKPRERKHKSFEGPTTPRKSQVTDDIIWSTPQGSADIQKQLEAAQSDGKVSIRDFNCIIKKMMKTIDNKNSQIQRLEEEKAVLKASAAAKEPTGRVPVQFDPNAAFPSIEQIITARDEAEKNAIYRLQEKAKEKGKK